MTRQWRITVHGVRGSAPRASRDCMNYGGNTTCFSVECGEQTIILDAGTGLSGLVPSPGTRRLDILISHFHLDHLQGLVSFRPLSDPHMEICFHGGAGLEKTLETLFGQPFWPIGIRDFPAKLSFHEILPGDHFGLGGLTVSTMAGNHPGGSILYRLDGDGNRLTYALDCELEQAGFPELTEFARGSALLIWDASFSPEHLRPGWGHSTWEQGLETGRAAGAGQVLMTHYSWGYTDEFLHKQEAIAGQNPICRFAKEGMVITL